MPAAGTSVTAKQRGFTGYSCAGIVLLLVPLVWISGDEKRSCVQFSDEKEEELIMTTEIQRKVWYFLYF